MKRSKKSRVSWLSGPNLCQVKLFRSEDCPAKVASQPQRLNYPKQSSVRRQVPDLPPGFEGNHYAEKLSVSAIPRIRWKRPAKFLVNDAWLLGDGGESTERRTENLRISKVLEAMYPHRSTIPSRPSVSPVVEAESFDDSKTPVIPIEDESESSEESSPNTPLESNVTASKQSPLETKAPCSIQELASGLAPELSLAASAALSALMKTREQGSMIDPDLLIKLLKDPEMIKNLIADTSGKSSETKNHPLETNNTNPTRIVPQHVTALPMTKPQPTMIPQKQSVAPSQPFTKPEQRRMSPPKPEQRRVSPPKLEQRRVSPPKSVNQNTSQLNQISRNPVSIPMSVQPCVSISKQPSNPARLPSSSVPLNVQRPPHGFSDPKLTMNPQSQPQHNSAYRTPEMNNVQAPVGFGRGAQTGFNNYPMNLNRIDATGRVNPVIQPMKNDDYFKNLIRAHGTVNHETNQYHSQTGKFNGRMDQTMVQKQCMYYGTPRGCQMCDSCVHVHDRFRPNFEAEAPRAKRLRFGRYERNGF